MRTQRDRNDGLRTDDCCHKTLLKKYVILCLICGGLSVLVGCLFIVIYFLFRSYTSSLQYFETIPTYIPSLMVMIFYYKDFIIFIHWFYFSFTIVDFKWVNSDVLGQTEKQIYLSGMLVIQSIKFLFHSLIHSLFYSSINILKMKFYSI